MIKSDVSGYLLKTAKDEEYLFYIKESLKGYNVFNKEVQLMLNKIDLFDLKSIPRLTQREKRCFIYSRKAN